MTDRRPSTPEPSSIREVSPVVSLTSISDSEDQKLDKQIRQPPVTFPDSWEPLKSEPNKGSNNGTTATPKPTTMSGFRVEPFAGGRTKDVDAFIRICAHDFRRMTNLYEDDEADRDKHGSIICSHTQLGKPESG